MGKKVEANGVYLSLSLSLSLSVLSTKRIGEEFSLSKKKNKALEMGGGRGSCFWNSSFVDFCVFQLPIPPFILSSQHFFLYFHFYFLF